jgi:DNA repair photolyase
MQLDFSRKMYDTFIFQLFFSQIQEELCCSINCHYCLLYFLHEHGEQTINIYIYIDLREAGGMKMRRKEERKRKVRGRVG